MFHKFKITTCAFILCLFGLTLMTVSPVFAADEDSPAFKQCQQIKGKMTKKNCFRDLARLLVGDSTEFIACQQMKRDTGGTKEKKNCFRALARAEQTPKSEVNLCLASLKEIDERTFRNCNSAEESVDTMRGAVCVDAVMWHNSYEGGTTDEIRKCGESKELTNQQECSSALRGLARAIKAFNAGGATPRRTGKHVNVNRHGEEGPWKGVKFSKRNGPRLSVDERNHIMTRPASLGFKYQDEINGTKEVTEKIMAKDWWFVDEVSAVNGSWRDARDACGF